MNCVLMCYGEKKVSLLNFVYPLILILFQILTFFLNFVRYVTPLFYLDTKEMKKKIKNDFVNGCPYEEYINDIILFLIRKESSNK